MYQKSNDERLIVHLFNDLDASAHHAFPILLREEVVPIRDIATTFRSQFRKRRVYLEPDGKELEVRKTAQGARVIVLRLDIHAMGAAELGVEAPK